jgi:hypothetical protein
MNRSVQHMRDKGMDIAAVGTGGDPGHGPARALYEALGYKRLTCSVRVAREEFGKTAEPTSWWDELFQRRGSTNQPTLVWATVHRCASTDCRP